MHVRQIKPPAEGIEPEVLRPGLFISEPTRQLRNENLLAQFLQYFADVLLRCDGGRLTAHLNCTTYLALNLVLPDT